MAYRVRNWDKHFENHKTRLLKALTWIPLPTDLGTAGYAELVAGHERGPAHFGVWVALLEVAARGAPRGHLSAGIRHHTARSLALMCRMPESLIEEALERLVNIGWIETWHHEGTIAPDQAPNPALERQIKDDTGNSETNERTNPLTPAERGEPALRANPRSTGTNPRAMGTNPRAVGDLEARAQASVGRHNPGTIKSNADLSYWNEKPEPITPEEIAELHRQVGGNPLKPMAPESLDQRRERLKEQARIAGERA